MQVIYGHRGASGYAPENTLEAFEMAAKMGAAGVELDVHIAKDGALVVAHDEAVDRALAAVDAVPLAGRRMDAVSGGERQRLALAMALATGLIESSALA